ncbi:MAG: energy transducer TonB [Caulobacter sp.]|nr:energy transducer TonB [Caulobacter sp.]
MADRERTGLTPALAASLALHVGLFAAVFLAGVFFKKPLLMGGAIPVTIVSQGPPAARMAELSNVEEISQGEEVVPEPEPEPVAPPEPIPEPSKTPPKPDPTPKPKPKPTQRANLDLDRLLTDVESSRPRPSRAAGGGGGQAQRDRTVAVGTSAGPSAGAKGYLLTLGSDLGQRWNPNCQVEGGADVNIRVSFIVSSNGRLLSTPVSSGDDASSSIVKSASDRAVRAVRMTEPFPNFPPELYGEKITVNFNANQVCGNR